MINNNNFNLCADAQGCNNLDTPVKLEYDRERGYPVKHEHDKKAAQSGKTECSECSADTKLFFDDVYKSGTRGKKQQVDVLQYRRSLLSKCAEYTQYFLSDVYTNSTQTKKAQVEAVQCGRSMIEMLGVLAIVGVLSVGGIAGYSKAMMKFKINKTIDQISHIVANIRTLYAQQTTYVGLNTANAIKMGVTPSELGSGTTLTNAFGGGISINQIGSYKSFFIIDVNNISKEACLSLVTYDWGKQDTSGLLAISASSFGVSFGELSETEINTSYTRYGSIGSNYIPMEITKAITLCSCEDNSCNVAWKFQ